MRVLVIFTGGTIGSNVQEGWIGPSRETKYTLIERYRKAHGEEVHFDFAEPYTLLSEHLSAAALNLLIQCVCENLNKAYDGIIVTHGTDTLQYSASAVAYAVGADSIPVLFVSSQRPLSDPEANGYWNFEGAVSFIKQAQGRGVYIAYMNKGEAVQFHRGTEVLSHGEFSDFIFSRAGGSSGKMPPALGAYRLVSHPGILVVHVHPADTYSYAVEQYKAVILRPYHSGTLDTANPDFADFCRRAARTGVPVFVTDISEGDVYESTKVYAQMRIRPLVDAPFISTFVKIWIAISLNLDIEEFIED